MIYIFVSETSRSNELSHCKVFPKDSVFALVFNFTQFLQSRYQVFLSIPDLFPPPNQQIPGARETERWRAKKYIVLLLSNQMSKTNVTTNFYLFTFNEICLYLKSLERFVSFTFN